MPDDVPEDEKKRRHQALDDLQAEVVAGINQSFLGRVVPVLVEDEHKGKWRGRSPQNKLVFFEDTNDRRGQIVDLEITWTGPWSMQGRIPLKQADSQADLLVIH
jgi:tRNA-2-methylthio-N6-dimethylallyladenosine synthase